MKKKNQMRLFRKNNFSSNITMAYFRRKYVKKGPKKAVRGRRRLFAAPIGVAAAVGAGKVVQAGRNYRRGQKRVTQRQASAALQLRLEGSDNIITNKTITVGKARKPSFNERVARVARPPMLFKRNFQWNAECESGRAAYFHVDFNTLNNSDLNNDMNTYKVALSTNTTTLNGEYNTAASWDGSKFYVDSLRETIRMVNSSSNSIKGKMWLIAYKRDSDNNYAGSGTPIAPPNMLAYFSTFGGISTAVTGGLADVVGNGYKFDSVTSGSNYTAPLNMPGGSLHPTAVCLQTDPQLGLFAPHVKDRMNFYFRVVNSSDFSLKPGQEFQQKIAFNDLKPIHREQQEAIHVAGVTYTLVIQFTGGIVGDNGAGAGVGLVTSGSCQLSCIRESTRTLGLVNPLRSQVLLQTAPLSIIPLAVQTTINPDTGVSLVGAQYDP